MLTPKHMIAGLALSLTVGTASAATISYSSGPFNASLNIFVDDFGNSSTSSPVNVTGLQQFNPALGTLTGVTFDVTAGSFTWNADLFGQPSTGAIFDGEYQTSIQADLGYTTGLSTIVIEGISDQINLFCSGDETMGDGCFDSIGNALDYTFNSFTVARTLGDFAIADLVGTGNVPNLRMDINLFNSSFVANSGLDFIEVSGLADITNANVQVTYQYTSAVPVPAAAWLFASGLIGLAGVAKRKR